MSPNKSEAIISDISLLAGVASAIDLVRESLIADHCDMRDPLAGLERDREGLLGLAQLGLQELSKRTE